MNNNNSRQSYLKEVSISNYLLLLGLFIILIRPIIDLTGSYDGESINLGAIFGFGFAIILFAITYIRFLERKKIYFFVLIISLIIFNYLLAIFVSGISQQTFISIGRFITGFSASLLLIMPVLKKKQIKYLITFFLYISLVPIFIAWLQFFSLYSYSYYDYVDGVLFGRPSGGYLQPNSLTRITLFGIILMYIYGTKFNISYFLKYSYITVALGTIFISGHRTSLVIAIAILLVLEFLIYYKYIIKKIPFYFGLIFILIILIFTLFQDKLIAYLDIYGQVFNGIIDSDGGIQMRGRGDIWNEVSNILGYYNPLQLFLGMGAPTREAHNDILRIIMVNGYLGLFLYFLIFVYTFLFVKKRVNREGLKYCILIYIYIFLFGITLQPTEYPHFMWMFYLVLFILLNLFKDDSKKVILNQ